MTDFRFDSKEEAVNHFFKEHGVGKSLYYDRKYSGQLQVKFGVTERVPAVELLKLIGKANHLVLDAESC
jgi:hypothetical protein